MSEGILFCARNQAGKVGLFAANKRTVVSEITSFVVQGANREVEVRQIKEVGDKIQVDLWDDAGQPLMVSLAKSDLMRIADERMSDGEKVRWGRTEFYR